MKNLEVLAPVGNMDMALAAIHNGADSIYVGFPNFNARGRTQDFSLSELKTLIDTCHLYGVRVYAALNILIFSNELENLLYEIKSVIELGIDGLIVQDIGLAFLIRKLCPDIRLHASTQMTVTSHQAIDLLKDLNIQRFVLARENSLPEISMIQANTNKELEVFVHGALCVSYSGQCLTSESIGGRSANRGQCAQSCRFHYTLFVDGHSLGTAKYFLSPKDLCGIDHIDELKRIGIQAIKIEGRLKSPEYVAAVTRSYRQTAKHVPLQLQNIQDIHNMQNVQQTQKAEQLLDIELAKKEMAITFSRGFGTGWLQGVNHQILVDGETSSHKGFYLGRIDKTSKNKLYLHLEANHDFKPGDGVVWFNQFNNHEGAQIYSATELRPHYWELEFADELVFGQASKGYKDKHLFLNHDSKLRKNLLLSTQDVQKQKKLPIQIVAHCQIGRPLQVEVHCGAHTLTLHTPSPIQIAKTSPMTTEHLTNELSALSHTPFYVEHIRVDHIPAAYTPTIGESTTNQDPLSVSQIFINHREIKRLRQEFVYSLSKLQTDRPPQACDLGAALELIARPLNVPDSQLNKQLNKQPDKEKVTSKSQLTVLLREAAQAMNLSLSANSSFQEIILDFEYGREYGESVKYLQNKGFKVGLATTRILKPNEYRNLDYLIRMNPDFILVRNLAALGYFKEKSPKISLRGDFSLNITNEMSFSYFQKHGLDSICLSYDMNFEQTQDLLKKIDPSFCEMTIHQYVPSFHMEHCVFAHNLSQGTSFINCGKPCDKHRLELKDQFGNHHFVKPDQECRNTLFNSHAQSAAHYIPEWQNLGVGRFRYEALFESDIESKIRLYQDLLQQKITSEELISQLRVTESYGLSDKNLAKSYVHPNRKKKS